MDAAEWGEIAGKCLELGTAKAVDEVLDLAQTADEVHS